MTCLVSLFNGISTFVGYLCQSYLCRRTPVIPIAERIRSFVSSLRGITSKVNLALWSYACHGAQCGVITSHSTCGCCVRDCHICFRLFALSSPSVLMLSLKDQRSGVDTIQAGSSSYAQVIWVARLSTQRIEKNPLLTNNKNGFYWNTFMRQ